MCGTILLKGWHYYFSKKRFLNIGQIFYSKIAFIIISI